MGPMNWVSAPIIEDAPLEPAHHRFLPAFLTMLPVRIDAFLERERAQLPLWFVASFGMGIAGWMWLPGPAQWAGLIVVALGLALTGPAMG